ncbi:hypothetical protein K9O30_16370 [Clostridium bowmanii]|uniref:hypothetical protein n=1 Tax=Clostridium bowmanii TaxID=132925 RepID=UPI001C0E7B9B|nr:hypothetical protein [Clostridium bowmanii]MBU3190832.1 hypothetical protein [Clostridium bowmanii]MCA1075265.1 hypothetical protein [Clostridium bowmanii]
MKNIKKVVLSIAVVSVLSTSVVFGVVATKSPADITAGLTGKTVEEVAKERTSGKTYGTIASEAGKLDEFKAESLKQKKVILDQRVKDGNLTQAEADKIYNDIKTNQLTCDGAGSVGIGKMNGTGFGKGQGRGKGMGRGMGQGSGQRNGDGCAVTTEGTTK